MIILLAIDGGQVIGTLTDATIYTAEKEHVYPVSHIVKHLLESFKNHGCDKIQIKVKWIWIDISKATWIYFIYIWIYINIHAK